MRAEARTSARTEKRPAAFSLENHLFYYVSLVLARRNKALNSELRRFGIDYSRWRVLAVLNEHAGCSMLELAEWSSVDRTTLAHTVRLMCEEGLLSRTREPRDRRRSILLLTPEGRRRLKSVLPLVTDQTERALQGLSKSEVETLRALLVRIGANLR